MEISDWRSWASILWNWALVGAAFALVHWSTNPLTVAVALLVLGGRQLGFAILMHEAAHRSLFRNGKWNDRLGNWLAAYPIWADVLPYRQYHFRHHARTWTPEDPDLKLATPFPVTRDSLARKVWRDLSGQTGWKRFRATLRRDMGGADFAQSRKNEEAGWQALRGVVITNAVLLAILCAVGNPGLYLLWVAAWYTTYSLAMRVRAIAEHAVVTNHGDPLQNTRTTLAGPLERLLFAPNYVNYHLEHHLLSKVPHYNLPKMHRMLKEKSILEHANVAGSYFEVLRLASSWRAV